nr:MAG TPA: hypothetical protein [Caudoviricetes sp.]
MTARNCSESEKKTFPDARRNILRNKGLRKNV